MLQLTVNFRYSFIHFVKIVKSAAPIPIGYNVAHKKMVQDICIYSYFIVVNNVTEHDRSDN